MEKTIGQYFVEKMNGEEIDIERLIKVFQLINNAAGKTFLEKINNALEELTMF